MKGVPLTEEHKIKIGLANTRKYSKELKQKLRREYASRISYSKLADKYHMNHKAVKWIITGVELTPIFCMYCGKLFAPKSLRHKFCSDKCKDDYKCRILGPFYAFKRKLAVVDYLGGQCVNCGNDDHKVLQINHIKGGGRKEYKIKNYSKVCKEILETKREGEFDLRCANCNVLYEYEVGRRKEY